MSIGKQKSKSSSKPLTAADLSSYFNELDAQTGGSHTGPTTSTRWVPDAGMPAADPNNPASMLYGGKGGENWAAGAGGHYETVTTPGSDSPGRLSEWAQSGTEAVPYQSVGAAQIGDQMANIRALGGYGATQQQQLLRARGAALDQIAADAGLDVTQKARSRQLSDNDYADRLAAIAREAEGQIAQGALGVASQNAQLQQQAGLEEARRRYAADLRNADLPKEDLMALAQIFFGGKGSTSSSNSSGFNLGFQPLPKA